MKSPAVSGMTWSCLNPPLRLLELNVPVSRTRGYCVFNPGRCFPSNGVMPEPYTRNISKRKGFRTETEGDGHSHCSATLLALHYRSKFLRGHQHFSVHTQSRCSFCVATMAIGEQPEIRYRENFSFRISCWTSAIRLSWIRSTSMLASTRFSVSRGTGFPVREREAEDFAETSAGSSHGWLTAARPSEKQQQKPVQHRDRKFVAD